MIHLLAFDNCNHYSRFFFLWFIFILFVFTIFSFHTICLRSICLFSDAILSPVIHYLKKSRCSSFTQSIFLHLMWLMIHLIYWRIFVTLFIYSHEILLPSIRFSAHTIPSHMIHLCSHAILLHVTLFVFRCDSFTYESFILKVQFFYTNDLLVHVTLLHVILLFSDAVFLHDSFVYRCSSSTWSRFLYLLWKMISLISFCLLSHFLSPCLFLHDSFARFTYLHMWFFLLLILLCVE